MAPSWAPSSCCALSTAAAMPLAPSSAPGGEGGDVGEEPKGVVAGTRTARPTVIGAPEAMEAKQPKSDVASRPDEGGHHPMREVIRGGPRATWLRVLRSGGAARVRVKAKDEVGVGVKAKDDVGVGVKAKVGFGVGVWVGVRVTFDREEQREGSSPIFGIAPLAFHGAQRGHGDLVCERVRDVDPSRVLLMREAIRGN